MLDNYESDELHLANAMQSPSSLAPSFFSFFCYRNGPGDHFHLRSSRKKRKKKKKRKPCVLGISIGAKRGTLSETMNNSRPARDNRCRARWSSVPTWQQTLSAKVNTRSLGGGGEFSGAHSCIAVYFHLPRLSIQNKLKLF